MHAKTGMNHENRLSEIRRKEVNTFDVVRHSGITAAENIFKILFREKLKSHHSYVQKWIFQKNEIK